MSAPRRTALRRTYTDVHSVSLQQKLIEALASGKLTKEQEEQLLQIAKGSTNLLQK